MHRIVLAIVVVSMLILCFALDARLRGSRLQGQAEPRLAELGAAAEL